MSRRRWTIAIAGLAAVGIGALGGLVLASSGSGPKAEVGPIREAVLTWRPADGPLAPLADVTDAWSAAVSHQESDPLSGGVAAADLDGDGRLDLAVAGGPLTLLFGRAGGGFDAVRFERQGLDRAVTGVTASDVDADGRPDLLVATRVGADRVVWGGAWARSRQPDRAAVQPLRSGDRTTALVAADLTADGRPDIVQAGYGLDRPARDAVLEQVGTRRFRERLLPGGARRSLAVEVADLTGDGRPDAWISRDVGWQQGGDSLYSAEPAGPALVDRAADLGTDLEVVGMCVTLADLGGGPAFDAYVSDIGENDFLVRRDDRFEAVHDVGAGRIRGPEAGDGEVSSSWSSGATDLNLDGRLDLVVANGGFPAGDVANKVPGTEIQVDDPPAILLQRPDGTFADAWPRIGLPWSGAARGMALGDLDGDGDQDLAIMILGEGLRVYRNDATGASLTVRASSAACPDGGAEVRVSGEGSRSAARLLAAHGFLSSHAPEVVFGTRGLPAKAVVRWPGQPPVGLQADGRGRTEVLAPCQGHPVAKDQP